MIGPVLAVLLAAETPAIIGPELKALITELASSAYMFGACERYIPARDADELMAEFSDLDGQPGRTEVEDFVVPILLENYAAGRREGRSLNLSSESCARLIRQAGEAVARAHSRAAATE